MLQSFAFIFKKVINSQYEWAFLQREDVVWTGIEEGEEIFFIF